MDTAHARTAPGLCAFSAGALLLLGACGGSAPAASSSGSTGSGATSSSGSSGSTSSGSTSSGSSGSGSTSGSSGSSGTTGALTDTLDPSQVYAVGTFDPTYCGSDALFAPAAPGDLLLGFPCFDAAFRVGLDGKLLYLESDANGNNLLRVFAADPPAPLDGGGWTYPPYPSQNDGLVPTPGCDALGGATELVLDADDGGAVYSCGSNLDWYDAAGTLRLSNASVVRLGAQGHALVWVSGALEVRDATGATAPLSGLTWDGATSLDTARVQPDGWWLAVEQGGARGLWHVDLSGTATLLGTYAAFTASSLTSALDAQGDLFVFGTDTDGTSDTIVELPRDGSPPVQRYTEAGAPAPDWSQTPPLLYPVIGAHGGRLVSGP